MNRHLSPAFVAFLATLTVEQARAWDASPEKFLFVDDEILSPNNYRANTHTVYAVENRFAELLEG